MLRKLQRQPVRVHPLSPRAERRRPVKQHLRQLKDITQCKNDHNMGANAAVPLDTLSKFTSIHCFTDLRNGKLWFGVDVALDDSGVTDWQCFG
ncbi:unnamed protein product [Leuciscus chuanchicus]